MLRLYSRSWIKLTWKCGLNLGSKKSLVEAKNVFSYIHDSKTFRRRNDALIQKRKCTSGLKPMIGSFNFFQQIQYPLMCCGSLLFKLKAKEKRNLYSQGTLVNHKVFAFERKLHVRSRGSFGKTKGSYLDDQESHGDRSRPRQTCLLK